MPVVDFPEWAPDLTAIGTGISPLISGVVPQADGYGPWKDFVDFTNALPGACRGGIFARRNDGSVAVFAATETNLYLLNNTTFTWSLVSKGMVSYSPLVATDNWQFRQFADTVIAVQAGTVPQKFVLSSSTEFADLGGSPPQASHIAVINGFLVLSGLTSNPRRIQWSDLFGIETWTAGTGLSDFQDMADGGTCHAITGGDYYGLLFQDDLIRRLVYVPGSATVFDIVKISDKDTLFAQYSTITVGSKTFFISAQGFRMVEAGGVPIPIGKERVDRTFFADVDVATLRLVLGSADPNATRVYWAYKSKSGSADLFDKIITYDWSIGKTGKWSVLPMSGEFLLGLAKPGVTLEALDAIAPGALDVTGTANNGSGAIRLTLNALTNGPFTLGSVGAESQNFITVYGVGGTTEANGSWPYTIIDATHIDLIGSTFVNAWTSGGHIGGSLDALPFSLDSVSTASITQLAMFDVTHKAGFFTGPNIEAILETGDFDNDGDLSFISSLRPITDCTEAFASVGHRKKAQDAVTYTTESAIIDEDGQCPQLVEDRYMRGRLRLPAAADWTFAKGLEPEVQQAGEI